MTTTKKNIANEMADDKKNKEFIYGNPIEAQGKTYIPVNKSTWHPSKNAKDDSSGTLKSEPVGFLEVREHTTRFIPARRSRLPYFFAFGAALGLYLGLKLSSKSD